jgi:hypothetical protein
MGFCMMIKMVADELLRAAVVSDMSAYIKLKFVLFICNLNFLININLIKNWLIKTIYFEVLLAFAAC